MVKRGNSNFFMNKKAQQSNWFMIVLVLAVITLVVVALALTGAFGKITKIFNLVNDLEGAVKSCEVHASQGLRTSYCDIIDDKFDVDGRTEYISCAYLESINKLSVNNPPECLQDLGLKAKTFCDNKNLDEDEWVNGMQCKNAGGNPNNPAD